MSRRQKAIALAALVIVTLAGAAIANQAAELVMPTAISRRAS